MASFSIPTEYLEGFAILEKLPEDDVNRIAESLRKIPIGGGRKSFVKAVGSVIANTNEVEIVAVSIHSMGRLISADDADLEKISEGLAIAFFRQTKSPASEETIKEFGQRILFLLSSWTSAKKTFKALKLHSHNKNIYRHGNIITDIRLLFDEELASKNRQAIILHQLKFEYIIDDNERKEFFITLENSDLLKLKEQINRALEKEQVIKDDYGREIEIISLLD